MNVMPIFDQYIAKLEDARSEFQRMAMDATRNVDDRMAMGHKAHRLREIIRQARKHALELGDA